MPSKTPKQAKLMRAVAHGWNPSRMKSPPSRAVAQEFVEADRKYSGGFAENRYWTGGLAAMGEVNSGIDETLNWLKGGHVNYYQEGGEVRPGHPEGPNPFNESSMPNAYARWERENHAAAAPPPPPAAEPEKLGIWETLMSYARGPQHAEEALRELEAETGEAHGGRVGYQGGGLAMAAPAGGVPPWIQPTGAGPGGMLPPEYMEEPQGYQFGGMAARMGPAMRGARGMRGYRGVPPQRGGLHPGAQGPRGGGLAAMMRQAQQQRGALHPGAQGPGRGFLSRFAQQTPGQPLHPGAQGPGGGGFMSRLRQMMEQQRGQQPGPDPHQGRIPVDMQPPPFNRTPSGEIDLGGGRTPEWGPGGPGRVGEVQAGGGMYTDPNHPNYSPPRPGGGFQIGGGKPMPGPGMMPPGEEGEGIPGGPRVPPNMRGYLQKMRMKNRPPANVGGGANRVGMQDQQGALSRALQRGTGRPPMSRRFGRGRAGPTR